MGQSCYSWRVKSGFYLFGPWSSYYTLQPTPLLIQLSITPVDLVTRLSCIFLNSEGCDLGYVSCTIYNFTFP